MNAPFVWFQHLGHAVDATARFYAELSGWAASDGPAGMTLLAAGAGPFAGMQSEEGQAGWLPYLEVDDVDAATTRAAALGAEVVAPRRAGPAGDFAVIRDPGGARLALWQKA